MPTAPTRDLVISFTLSTHNRREVLLHTLRQIDQCGLTRDEYEVIIVDNASSDGTAEAVPREFPDVRLLPQHRNLGSCAKNFALPHARGQYIVFLDDDSFPAPGSIRRMIRHFEADDRLGAAVFTVVLPDGSLECSAYPDVFIGCGTGLRRSAIEQVGGLPDDFFMQAEEYDLSLRLLDAGWDVRRFEDLHVTHLKTPRSRVPWRTMRLDVRNNYLVATRHFPDGWMAPFRRAWMNRYWRIAGAKGQRAAFLLGLVQGKLAAMRPGHRRPVTVATFERFTRIHEIEQRLRESQQHLGLRSVLFTDLGKNFLPYLMAARACGIEVVAIADDRLARGRFLGTPIVTDAVARRLEFDAVIISSMSPVHAEERRRAWLRFDDRPVIDLLRPETFRSHTCAIAA
jgi:GT2 family glycosyltransferase